MPMHDLFDFLAFAANVRDLLFAGMIIAGLLFVAYLLFDH